MVIRYGVLILLLTLCSTAVADELRIEVDLSESKLRAVLGDQVQEYDVGVGSKKHPTPQGVFTIKKVVWNPSWVPPPEKWARNKSAKPPGHPDNPMKRVKVFFKEPDYYIHGSDEPEGNSHGCIRMSPEQAAEIAQLVMEHGGQPRDLPWYRRIFKRRSTKVVLLTEPVAIQIRG